MPLPDVHLFGARRVLVWRSSVSDKKQQPRPPYLNPQHWRVVYQAARKDVINLEE